MINQFINVLLYFIYIHYVCSITYQTLMKQVKSANMKTIFSILFIIAFLQVSYSQSDSVRLVQFSSGYTFPLGLENCGDTRLFIVQKGGQIMVSDSSGVRDTIPFLDIKGRVNSSADEGGLLGLAFDPHYSATGLFYVYYVNNAGNTQISQFKTSSTDANSADSNSEKKVLEILLAHVDHIGGCLRFGPDGYLYLGMGDGNDSTIGDPNNNAQNPSLLLGKILRIKVKSNGTYSIPKSNPFRHTANYRKEIWDVGVRNPWRYSFDALTGSLVVADVGEAKWEEIDIEKAGSKGGLNYGWRCYEGDSVYNNTQCLDSLKYLFPVYVYTHDGSPVANCAITGGFIYRGSKYPALYGKYFFTDFCSGVIRSLTFNSNAAPTETDELKSKIYYALTSFGEDFQHELYAVSSAGGTIYRITYQP